MEDLNDVPQIILDRIKLFFEDYKKLEKKSVDVKDFHGKEKSTRNSKRRN